jgi:hypothetical protein
MTSGLNRCTCSRASAPLGARSTMKPANSISDARSSYQFCASSTTSARAARGTTPEGVPCRRKGLEDDILSQASLVWMQDDRRP